MRVVFASHKYRFPKIGSPQSEVVLLLLLSLCLFHINQNVQTCTTQERFWKGIPGSILSQPGKGTTKWPFPQIFSSETTTSGEKRSFPGNSFVTVFPSIWAEVVIVLTSVGALQWRNYSSKPPWNIPGCNGFPVATFDSTSSMRSFIEIAYWPPASCASAVRLFWVLHSVRCAAREQIEMHTSGMLGIRLQEPSLQLRDFVHRES